MVDPNQGLAPARAKCGAWGYTDAEPFGGQVTKCNSTDYQGNRNGWVATASYQCIGSPSK
ncbi:MAG TPA: YecR family lipoprotein [Candidatus Kryptonia bacterium]|nr:YecR family lipoprotein [Candidatus Kryptonia bacterium]